MPLPLTIIQQPEYRSDAFDSNDETTLQNKERALIMRIPMTSRIPLAFVTSLILGATLLASERSANAIGSESDCWSGTDPQKCQAPWWAPYNQGTFDTSWHAWIGSDGDGQWVAWQADDTGACEWYFFDYASAMTMDMSIIGGNSSDHIQVVPSSGVTVCGFTLAPPIYDGHRIHIIGGLGVDYLIAGTGLGDMFAEYGDQFWETDANQLITYNPQAMLMGANGNDQLINRATPALATFIGLGGNDLLLTPKRGSVSSADCGGPAPTGGSYCGPNPIYKVQCGVSTICNTW